jgi:hypothetical protein
VRASWTHSPLEPSGGVARAVDGAPHEADDARMARSRKPPVWEREAPLTPRRAAEILKRVRATYVAMVACFWLACALVLIAAHRTLALSAIVIVLALLNAATMGWLYRYTRAAIRRNTTAQASDRLDIGL